MVAAETGPSGYEVIALIAAGIGAVTGVAALVWNIAEYRLSGPRVKAELMFGAVGPGGLVSKRGSPPKDSQLILSQGFSEPLVGINLVNVGRASTRVDHFGCRLSNGFALADMGLSYNPPNQFVLEPHRSETYWLPAREVFHLAESTREVGKPATTARMEAEITGPRTVRTKSFQL